MMALEDKVVSLLAKRHMTVATAESCTGGLLSGRLINVPGASDVINVGFVTYSNDAKSEYLGVSADTLRTNGAVSPECAKEMAEGVAARTGSDAGLATTGIAGPGGGTDDKPVGLVYIGCCIGGTTKVMECHFDGDRMSVRQQAVETALTMLYEGLSDQNTER